MLSQASFGIIIKEILHEPESAVFGKPPHLPSAPVCRNLITFRREGVPEKKNKINWRRAIVRTEAQARVRDKSDVLLAVLWLWREREREKGEEVVNFNGGR